MRRAHETYARKGAYRWRAQTRVSYAAAAMEWGGSEKGSYLSPGFVPSGNRPMQVCRTYRRVLCRPRVFPRASLRWFHRLRPSDLAPAVGRDEGRCRPGGQGWIVRQSQPYGLESLQDPSGSIRRLSQARVDSPPPARWSMGMVAPFCTQRPQQDLLARQWDPGGESDAPRAGGETLLCTYQISRVSFLAEDAG